MKSTSFFLGLVIIFSSFFFSCNPCRSFFTYKTTTINVKGITAKLKKQGVEVADLGIAEFTIDPKYSESSDQLRQLDLIQFSLCKTIKSMPKKSKERLTAQVQYTTTLTDMFKLTSTLIKKE